MPELSQDNSFNSAPDAWVCVDAGTSFIKAVLLDSSGRQLALARTGVPVLRPAPSHAEQDMAAVWEAVAAMCREVLADYRGLVRGIVTTAQGDGVWLVDQHGEPAAHAILWNDGRGAGYATTDSEPSLRARAFAVSGSAAYPGLASAILPWLGAHRPKVLSRARWMLTANGWLHLQLTGKALADTADSSNPFGEVVAGAKRYSPELLDLYGVSEWAHLLPPVCGEFAPVSPLRTEAALELGLPAGLPVVMAPYDIVTAAAGCGSVEPGEGCLILGTTICAEVVADTPGFDRAAAGTTLALPNGLFLRAMPTLTGCEALDWVMGVLSIDSWEELERLAGSIAPGADNLVFLPYLSPAGERAPFLDAAARGSFLGLGLGHGRPHMARAVFEGLSFAVRDCLQAALDERPARLAVCGGGSRSDLWCQIIADVCGCEVVRTTATEVGARGALAYAVAAMDGISSLARAARAGLAEARCFLPDRARQASYDRLFQRFMRLRHQAAATWALMLTGEAE